MKFTKIVKAEEVKVDQKEIQFYKDAKKKAESIASKYNCKISGTYVNEIEPGVVNKEEPFKSIDVERGIGKIFGSDYDYSNKGTQVSLDTGMGSKIGEDWSIEEIREHLDKCNRILDCLEELKETFFK